MSEQRYRQERSRIERGHVKYRDKLKEEVQELTKKYEGLAADMAKKREDEVMEG